MHLDFREENAMPTVVKKGGNGAAIRVPVPKPQKPT